MSKQLLARLCVPAKRVSTVWAPLAAGLLLWASPVLAQEAGEPLRPPTTSEPPSGPKFVVIGIAVVLLAGVIFAATLKSKRGHQD